MVDGTRFGLRRRTPAEELQERVDRLRREIRTGPPLNIAERLQRLPDIDTGPLTAFDPDEFITRQPPETPAEDIATPDLLAARRRATEERLATEEEEPSPLGGVGGAARSLAQGIGALREGFRGDQQPTGDAAADVDIDTDGRRQTAREEVFARRGLDNPFGAIGLILSNVAAGFQGRELPSTKLSREIAEAEDRRGQLAAEGMRAVQRGVVLAGRQTDPQKRDALINRLEQQFGQAVPGYGDILRGILDDPNAEEITKNISSPFRQKEIERRSPSNLKEVNRYLVGDLKPIIDEEAVRQLGPVLREKLRLFKAAKDAGPQSIRDQLPKDEDGNIIAREVDLLTILGGDTSENRDLAFVASKSPGLLLEFDIEPTEITLQRRKEEAETQVAVERRRALLPVEKEEILFRERVKAQKQDTKLTAKQASDNARIDAAIDVVNSFPPEELARRTEKKLARGLDNPDFDQRLADIIEISRRRKTGPDPGFQARLRQGIDTPKPEQRRRPEIPAEEEGGIFRSVIEANKALDEFVFNFFRQKEPAVGEEEVKATPQTGGEFTVDPQTGRRLKIDRQNNQLIDPQTGERFRVDKKTRRLVRIQ